MTMPTTIGTLLKSRREELGFSLSQMSEKTKVPLHKLQAIEDDNIGYFKDEITYLKFYVRYYFTALHLNFDDYKEVFSASIDSYTETAQLVKTQEMRDLHKRVASHADVQLNQRKKTSNRKGYTKRVRSDFAFILMIVVGLLIVLSLLFIFFKTVLPLMSQTPQDNVVIVVPDPIIKDEEPTDEPDPEVPVVFTVTLSSERDPRGQRTIYDVTGFSEGDTVTFEVEVFATASWISSKVDGLATVNPPSKNYVKGTTYSLIVTAQLERVVEITIGKLQQQVLRINETEISLDEELLKERISSSITFRFVEKTP
jgi:cytoskeletal protein RodZ